MMSPLKQAAVKDSSAQVSARSIRHYASLLRTVASALACQERNVATRTAAARPPRGDGAPQPFFENLLLCFQTTTVRPTRGRVRVSACAGAPPARHTALACAAPCTHRVLSSNWPDCRSEFLRRCVRHRQIPIGCCSCRCPCRRRRHHPCRRRPCHPCRRRPCQRRPCRDVRDGRPCVLR